MILRLLPCAIPCLSAAAGLLATHHTSEIPAGSRIHERVTAPQGTSAGHAGRCHSAVGGLALAAAATVVPPACQRHARHGGSAGVLALHVLCCCCCC